LYLLYPTNKRHRKLDVFYVLKEVSKETAIKSRQLLKEKNNVVVKITESI